MTSVLYSAKAASATTSDLYTLDPATAAPSSIGATGHAFTSLCFDPTDDVLYGTTSAQSAANPDSLYTIDPATGTATLVGAMGGTVSDIAIDVSGQMWGWTRRTSNGGLGGTFAALLQIDKTDASFSVIGSSGLNMQGGGISFHSSGVLYALIATSASANLYTINTSTGILTSLGSVGTIVSSASFDTDDLLWYLTGGAGGTARLKTLAVPGLTPVTIGNPGNDFDALAWFTPSAPPVVLPPKGRPTWRFVVTDLSCATITILDALSTDRSVIYELNAPAQASGKVPAESPEVNLLHTDGEPFLAEGVRFLYGFRREGGGGGYPVWRVRFAGLMLQPNDIVQNDVPYTAYAAFDPWEYLNHRPVVLADGTLPLTAGRQFTAVAGNTIVTTLLTNSQSVSGAMFIDYGQTAFYGGTIATTDAITINFQQGATLGEALTQLANTGTIDIVLTPIYDPVNRPGLIAELSIYAIAGQDRPEAIFAWDKPSRSLTGIDRLEDGTQRINSAQWISSDGTATAPQVSVASIAKFKEYWSTQTIAAQTSVSVVEALAAEQVLMRKNHPTTIKMDIAPERSPVLFNEYFLGDTVPIYASKRLRKKLAGPQRVYKIPVLIADDSVELVQQLEFSAETLTPS